MSERLAKKEGLAKKVCFPFYSQDLCGKIDIVCQSGAQKYKEYCCENRISIGSAVYEEIVAI